MSYNTNKYSILFDNELNTKKQKTIEDENQNKLKDIIDFQNKIIRQISNNNLPIIVKDTKTYDVFQHELEKEKKEYVIKIKDSVYELKKLYTESHINFNFINMFDNDELNCILKNVLQEILKNTNYTFIVEDNINSYEFVDGYVLLIKNNNCIDSNKIQFIKWLIRQCIICIGGTTLGSSKPLFNINKKNGSVIMYFDIYLIKNNLKEIKALEIIVNEFNKIISCVGDTEYEIDDKYTITNEISILEKKRNEAFNDREKFKSINSKIKELIEQLNDDVESTFKKKGKGSKIRAEIFDNRINLIIPYKYDNQFTGFEKILYNIIEMMYLLLKKFCETNQSLTEAKLENFLNLYFKGTHEKRPLLFLNIIDKLVGFDKNYFVFKSDKLIQVKRKCGEKFQKSIQNMYLTSKNSNYISKYKKYINDLEKINTQDIKTKSKRDLLNILRKFDMIDSEEFEKFESKEQICSVAEFLVQNVDKLRIYSQN